MDLIQIKNKTCEGLAVAVGEEDIVAAEDFVGVAFLASHAAEGVADVVIFGGSKRDGFTLHI